MYNWPEYCLEVCSILTLGKQLSVWEWEMVAKAQDIMAWLPMIDAAIARMNVGQNNETASKWIYKNLDKEFNFIHICTSEISRGFLTYRKC